MATQRRLFELPEQPSAEVLQSCTTVASHAKDINIDENCLARLARELYSACKCGEMSVRNWHARILHPQKRDDRLLEWIFVADTLNFSFWTDCIAPPRPVGDNETSLAIAPEKNDDKNAGKYFVNYGGASYTGYFALCAALQRAINESEASEAPYPFSPSVYSNWSLQDLKNVLKADSATPMPLLEERWHALTEAGKVISRHFDGQVTNIVKAANKSSQQLLRLLLEYFPSYRDMAEYQLPDGEFITVYFLKRAQIFVADVWSAFNGEGIGEFSDIELITMFADYRIPQVLAYHGVLKYSGNLLQKLEAKTMLESSERDEVELRACSIVAVNMLVQQVKKLAAADGVDGSLLVNAILVDNYLWDYRRDHVEEIDTIPYHRIRCIYY